VYSRRPHRSRTEHRGRRSLAVIFPATHRHQDTVAADTHRRRVRSGRRRGLLQRLDQLGRLGGFPVFGQAQAQTGGHLPQGCHRPMNAVVVGQQFAHAGLRVRRCRVADAFRPCRYGPVRFDAQGHFQRKQRRFAGLDRFVAKALQTNGAEQGVEGAAATLGPSSLGLVFPEDLRG
jgi:hypothetical protein